MLRSRNFLDVRLSASGFKKPSLKSCTVLLRKMLVQLRVIIGDCRANGCENRRHTGRQSNGQHHESCSTVMPTNLADCQMSAP